MDISSDFFSFSFVIKHSMCFFFVLYIVFFFVERVENKEKVCYPIKSAFCICFDWYLVFLGVSPFRGNVDNPGNVNKRLSAIIKTFPETLSQTWRPFNLIM